MTLFEENILIKLSKETNINGRITLVYKQLP